MRIFITGGTGFVGSAVSRELRAAGHHLTGLARSPAAAAQLVAAGVTPHHGELTDASALRAAASAADAVVHCAFIHDFSAYAAAARTDLLAIEAIVDGLAAGPAGKVLVCTSGTALLPAGPVGTEHDAVDPDGLSGPRVPTEHATRAAAARGVRSAVLRLPPSVHGAGDHGFVPLLRELARTSGVAAYLGDGTNRWGAVHRDDAAVLYRLAVEGLAAGTVPPGAALHGAAEPGIPMRDIAQAIADSLGLGLAAARGADHFGWFAAFAALDNPVSTAITMQLTGWRPSRAGLLEDLRSPAYAG